MSICQYWPCHKLVKDFSCDYCFCPNYKKECQFLGGEPKFIYTKKEIIKDCSDCILPHTLKFRKSMEAYKKYLLEKLAGSFSQQVPLRLDTEMDEIIERIGSRVLKDEEYRNAIGVPEEILQTKDNALITRDVIKRALENDKISNVVLKDLEPFTLRDLKDVYDVIRYW